MPSFPWSRRRDVPPIGEATLAALLAGADLRAGPAPELRPLAEALAGLRSTAADDELAGETETLAAFRHQFGALGTPHPHRAPVRKPGLPRRFLPVKTAAAVAAIAGLGGIATAAYAGMLPDAGQRLAHDLIGAPAPPSGSPPGPVPPSSGHSGYGLCAAWAHARAQGTPAQRAEAFRRLAAAAGGADRVRAYCGTAASPGASQSRAPQPDPTPHRAGARRSHPTPRSTGRPSGLPTPHRTGAPAEHPTGEPSRHL